MWYLSRISFIPNHCYISVVNRQCFPISNVGHHLIIFRCCLYVFILKLVRASKHRKRTRTQCCYGNSFTCWMRRSNNLGPILQMVYDLIINVIYTYIYIHIYILLKRRKIRSCHNFAPVTTAVQNCELIGSLWSKLEQNIFFIKFQ